MLKKEDDYISPPLFIIDTPLRGSEYAAALKLLAQKIDIPTTIKGQYNIYNGVLIQDDRIHYL